MYLGGFIGAANDTKEYIGKKVDNWFNSEKLFSNISVKQPQSALSDINCSIKHKWDYTQKLIDQPDGNL